MDEYDFLTFGSFRFDCMRDRLWREQKAIELRAKPRAVLRYLLQHPGQVVTRNELLKEVWPGIYVSKTTLRVCIREIRLALGDDITAPQYKDLNPPVNGAPHERMLRELAEGMAALSALRPIVLVLEDLHWSDSATVERSCIG